MPPVPSDTLVRHIIRDLLKGNIVDDDDVLSFELNGKEFIVNGVKQPDAVFQQFRDRHIKDAENLVIYEHHDGTTHTEIHLK